MTVNFTSAEAQIIGLMRANPTISNMQIAEGLGKNIKTIESQMTALYKRAGITGDQCQKRIALVLMILNDKS